MAEYAWLGRVSRSFFEQVQLLPIADCRLPIFEIQGRFLIKSAIGNWQSAMTGVILARRETHSQRRI